MAIRKLLAATAISAAVAMTAGAGVQAQTLRYAAAAPVLTMDPHATNDFVSQMVIGQIPGELEVALPEPRGSQDGIAGRFEILADRNPGRLAVGEELDPVAPASGPGLGREPAVP